jgi:hypothetical protein
MAYKNKIQHAACVMTFFMLKQGSFSLNVYFI